MVKELLIAGVVFIILCILGYSALQYSRSEETNKEKVQALQPESKTVQEPPKVEVDDSSPTETPVVAPLYAPTDENHPLFGLLPGDIIDEKSLNYLW